MIFLLLLAFGLCATLNSGTTFTMDEQGGLIDRVTNLEHILAAANPQEAARIAYNRALNRFNYFAADATIRCELINSIVPTSRLPRLQAIPVIPKVIDIPFFKRLHIVLKNLANAADFAFSRSIPFYKKPSLYIGLGTACLATVLVLFIFRKKS